MEKHLPGQISSELLLKLGEEGELNLVYVLGQHSASN